MEWIAALLPKPIRLPLALFALIALCVTGALEGFWALDARAAETAATTVKAVINTEVSQQLRTEAKNAAVEAAKEAVREAAKDAQADRDYVLQRQAFLENRVKELESKAALPAPKKKDEKK
jgi:hypothetical protein